jgi:sec-independent protein translocase protein TatA
MVHDLYLITFPGGLEWILIFLAVLLLFGGRKIPELMKGIGKGIREFNSAKTKVRENLEDGMKEEDKEGNKSTKKTDSNQKDQQ